MYLYLNADAKIALCYKVIMAPRLRKAVSKGTCPMAKNPDFLDLGVDWAQAAHLSTVKEDYHCIY